MSYEIVGKLIEKYPTIQRTDTFKTREFVIEKVEGNNGRNFSSYIKFQLIQDKTALIDNVPLQSEITVFFNIKGTKWSKNGVDNYITNLDAWRITANNVQNAEVSKTIENDFTDAPEEENDLPF
ncbi:MAG: DUF3127 domain-containing protein [Sediminibacterium sp.]|nr:DUF3127 domain-containing protein [Sediminibacterium sp.]